MVKVDLSPMKKFNYIQVANYKFEFFLLNEKFQALHTPFDCKDYLNDMFFAEYTGNPITIWGLVWKQGMIDISQEVFHLALSGGKEVLKDRIAGMQEFMNHFDKAQGFRPTEIHETEDEKVIVVDFSKEWTQNGPLLSAYMTLLRISGTFQAGEDPLEYMKRLMKEGIDKKETGGYSYPKYMVKDVNNLPKYIHKAAAVLAGVKVEHSWDKFVGKDSHSVHNTGIIGYSDFPTVEI